MRAPEVITISVVLENFRFVYIRPDDILVSEPANVNKSICDMFNQITSFNPDKIPDFLNIVIEDRHVNPLVASAFTGAMTIYGAHKGVMPLELFNIRHEEGARRRRMYVLNKFGMPLFERFLESVRSRLGERKMYDVLFRALHVDCMSTLTAHEIYWVAIKFSKRTIVLLQFRASAEVAFEVSDDGINPVYMSTTPTKYYIDADADSWDPWKVAYLAVEFMKEHPRCVSKYTVLTDESDINLIIFMARMMR